MYEWLKNGYEVDLKWCLDRPILSMVLATIVFGASLLRRSPTSAASSMPHLDEGALWMRAIRMPYTISFEEAAKFAPEILQDSHDLPASDGGRLGVGTLG